MNEARLTDDIKYGNVATENCADAVMKMLWKNDKGKDPRDNEKLASGVFCPDFHKTEHPLLPSFIPMVMCLCVWADTEEREGKTEENH